MAKHQTVRLPLCVHRYVRLCECIHYIYITLPFVLEAPLWQCPVMVSHPWMYHMTETEEVKWMYASKLTSHLFMCRRFKRFPRSVRETMRFDMHGETPASFHSWRGARGNESVKWLSCWSLCGSLISLHLCRWSEQTDVLYFNVDRWWVMSCLLSTILYRRWPPSPL